MLMAYAKTVGLLFLGATVLSLGACDSSNSTVSPGMQPAGLTDLVGPYVVYNDTLTKKFEHEDSRFLVFETPSGYGVGFLQPRGNHPGALLCFKTTEVDDKTLYCEQSVGGKKERLTIGRLDSKFCRDIGRSGDDCTAKDAKCACYCIEHGSADKKQCEKGKDVIEALWPPGNGAGSGGNH